MDEISTIGMLTSLVITQPEGINTTGLMTNLVVTAPEGTSATGIAVMLVLIPPAGSAPVADAGANQSVETGAVVNMDGTNSSDPDMDVLAYSWSFTSVPLGSTAVFDDDAIAEPSFTADLDGVYEIELEVDDGNGNTDTDTVTITASVGGGAVDGGILQDFIPPDFITSLGLPGGALY